VLEPAPAIHEQENGNRAEPKIVRINREPDECGDAKESEDSRDQQAASAAHHKPQQGTKNLAAIERIDRENVEHEQSDIDKEDGVQEWPQIVYGRIPSRTKADLVDRNDDGSEDDVNQRAGGDAP